ncbi:MAG: hypothetical protein SGPRY_003339 [Prymnesium sp.]
MGYSMLESAARDGGVRPYPLLRRHNYAQLQLAATLTITVTLTCVFSLLIGLLMFMGVEEDSAAMMRKYGSHKCPKGSNMAGYDFAKPSFPRTDKCEELLALLSCARCSSFAGHYDNSDPTVPVTTTVCRDLVPESFVRNSWGYGSRNWKTLLAFQEDLWEHCQQYGYRVSFQSCSPYGRNRSF